MSEALFESKVVAEVVCSILAGYRTTKEIAIEAQVDKGLISKTLAQLREAGLVKYTAIEGVYRYHGIDIPKLTESLVKGARYLMLAEKVDPNLKLSDKIWRNRIIQNILSEFLGSYYRTAVHYGGFKENLSSLIVKLEEEVCRVAPFLQETPDMTAEEREAVRLLKEWGQSVMKAYETYALWGALRKHLKQRIPGEPVEL